MSENNDATCPMCGELAEWADCVTCGGIGSGAQFVGFNCPTCHTDSGFWYCPYGCDEYEVSNKDFFPTDTEEVNPEEVEK